MILPIGNTGKHAIYEVGGLLVQPSARARRAQACLARERHDAIEMRRARALYSIEEGLFVTVREWLVEELSAAKEVPPGEITAHLVEACD